LMVVAITENLMVIENLRVIVMTGAEMKTDLTITDAKTKKMPAIDLIEMNAPKERNVAKMTRTSAETIISIAMKIVLRLVVQTEMRNAVIMISLKPFFAKLNITKKGK